MNLGRLKDGHPLTDVTVMTSSKVVNEKEGSRRLGLPRLTSKVFVDLGIWMVSFGVLIGVGFPDAIVFLGVPAAYAHRPTIYVGTIGAGLLVGLVNFLLARFVVGSRVRHLSRGMARVTGVISEATTTGDWGRCSPEDCRIDVDSKDELGAAAEAYNSLLLALDLSRMVQGSMTAVMSDLSEHLAIGDLASAALASFVHHGGAAGGLFFIAREGELHLASSLYITDLSDDIISSVTSAMTSEEVSTFIVPEGIELSSTMVTFRPTSMRVVPISFKGLPLGAVVLAYSTEPSAALVNLLSVLRAPTGVALNNALAYEAFQRLAAVDPLTGAYNRRFGFERLQEEYFRSLRSSVPLGLVSFDLDHFKDVNDTYGHLAGDRVLREVTAIAKLGLREGDVLIRTGGEEFLVLLPGAGLQDTREAAQRICHAVSSASIAMAQSSISVTISAGALSFPEVRCTDMTDLLAMVDNALYRSKGSGRNRVTVVPGEATRLRAHAPLIS